MKKMGVQDQDGTKQPSEKKLKQATLSFFTMANKQSSESKKRKKSESDSDDIKVLKVLCNEKNNGISDISKETSVLQVKDDNTKTESKENGEAKEVTVEEAKDEDAEAESSETPDHSSDASDKAEASSEQLSMEESELDVSSANVSLNVSSLVDTDDRDDSLVSFSDIPLTPMKSQVASAKKPRKLTPKQVQRQQENQKRREEKEREKEREKEEREKKKLEEKENRKRQREEKEEQRQKERLEKLQKKQAEIDQKNEEKKAREDERRKKEEEKVQEKKRKEEERLQDKKRKEEERVKAEEDKKRAEEEAAKKKEKAAAAFASFFTLKPNSKPKDCPSPETEEEVKTEQNFMPFRVKADMRLAPPTRFTLPSEQKQAFDHEFVSQQASKLYLTELKHKGYKVKTSSKTWPVSELNEEVVIIENKKSSENQVLMSTGKKERMRAKLLLFVENRRPAYWGTWRKKSKCIGPRQPLALDKVHFDYEVDSDDEWEEEEEQGESLHGSDDEKESEDEYEVDNQMFVPHGYLSDDEEGLDEALPPELKKESLKLKEMEFQAEMKKKLKPLKPEIIGPFWQYPERPSDTLTEWEWMFEELKSFQVVMWGKEVLCFPPGDVEELRDDSDCEANNDVKMSAGSAKRGARAKTVPEEAIPDFIRLLHGNSKSKKFLAKEFVEYWDKLKNPEYRAGGGEDESPASNCTPGKSNKLISLANACRTLKSLGSWGAFPEEGPMHNKMCWYVPVEQRSKHNLLDLPLPNEWSYILKDAKARGRPKEEKVKEEATTSAGEEPVPSKGATPKSLITKFTKKMSEAERKQQIKRKSAVEVSATPPKVKIKSVTSSPFSPSSAFRISPSTTSAIAPGIKAYCTPNSGTKASPGSTPGSEFKAPAPPLPTSRTPSSSGEKKGRRVSILVSVPCGQEIPSQGDTSTFTKQATTSQVARAFQFSQSASKSNANDEDDCVMLD